jgi:hypothetical protein
VSENNKEDAMPENKCVINPLGVFLCTSRKMVDCSHFSDSGAVVNCKHVLNFVCTCREAKIEAARTAAKASLDRCREEHDSVLDALNKLAWLVMQEEEKNGNS